MELADPRKIQKDISRKNERFRKIREADEIKEALGKLKDD